MPGHPEAMRALTAKYLELARISVDSEERRKFFGYATLYAELADKAAREESLIKWTVFTETTGFKRTA